MASLVPPDRREGKRPGADRRRVSRGGRRPTDRSGRHPRILVAEHDDGVRRPCVRYFDQFKFRVTEVDNGNAVLDAVTASTPHVIVVELRLPKMPAWQLSRWLANNFRTRDIPVIVMADDPGGEDTQRVLESAASVLIKPIPLATMLDEVRRVLRNRKTTTGPAEAVAEP
jgi:DNA-binding response OmpR family regulator